MMTCMGFEIIFLFLLALILFGPRRLPEIAREVGKFVSEFRRASNEFKSQVQIELDKAGRDVPPASPNAATTSLPAASPAPLTQSLIPNDVKEIKAEVNSAKDELIRAARLAFDAQRRTVPAEEPPTIVAEPVPEPAVKAETVAEATPSETGATEASSATKAVNR